MQQINLKSESAASQAKFKQAVGGVGSLVFGLILIFVGAGTYAGLFYYDTKVKAQTEDYKTRKVEEFKKLSGKEYQELYFFQDRLRDLSMRLDKRVDHDEVLQKLSNVTLPEIVYTTVKIVVIEGKSEVEVDLMAGDYETMNRQLKAFTLIEGISDYAPNSISKDQQSSAYHASVKFKLTGKPAAAATQATPTTVAP